MNKDFYVKRWAFEPLRSWLKSVIPTRMHGVFSPFSKLLLRIYNLPPTLPFVISPPPMEGLSYLQRVSVAYRVDRVSRYVRCSHNEKQIMRVFQAALSLPPDEECCIVEAGSFKGGSGAKFSILAKLTGRRLFLFDSFEGLPDNEEEHEDDVFGKDLRGGFAGGEYMGGLDEVQANIQKYGVPEVCTYKKGWFEDTMPGFSEKVGVAYIDVDLASSTKTCLKYLYPLLVPGGTLVSQDGHIPLVVDVFRDRDFWISQLGCEPPPIEGLGKDPLIIVTKPM